MTFNQPSSSIFCVKLGKIILIQNLAYPCQRKSNQRQFQNMSQLSTKCDTFPVDKYRVCNDIARQHEINPCRKKILRQPKIKKNTQFYFYRITSSTDPYPNENGTKRGRKLPAKCLHHWHDVVTIEMRMPCGNERNWECKNLIPHISSRHAHVYREPKKCT